MRRKVLWISLNAPYDKVDHAGGQVHNYYLKRLHERNAFDIQVITFCHPSELPKIDLKEYGIKATVFPQETRGLKHLFWGIVNAETKYNPLNRYCGITYNFFEAKIKNRIHKLVKEGYSPDVIILQWTQMVLFIKYLRKVFPKAKFICIEEDVTYLGFERRWRANPKFLTQMRYKRMRRIELDALQYADQIICSNKKDVLLLKKEKLTNPIWSWCPYYNNMTNIERRDINNDILFFGAMNRKENWKSAIWFIENVFSQLKDNHMRFVALGSKPPKELQAYASEQILVTGFVEDIKPYFEQSRCLVVPLVLGAGIKIKVLEGLSSGIPVISNAIGIEGIPARDGVEYFHCETAQEFKTTIEKICGDIEKSEGIGKQGRNFVNREFDFASNVEEFMKIVMDL